MNQEIISLIKPIVEAPRASHPFNILSEISLFRQVMKEHEWNLLSDVSKAEKRKTQFGLWAKWSFQERMKKNYTEVPEYVYFEKCIKVYEIIQQKITLIDTLCYGVENAMDSKIKRLKALLLIEAKFINDMLIPVKHVPIFLFRELQKELSDSDLVGIDDFLIEYEILYENWKEKPL